MTSLTIVECMDRATRLAGELGSGWSPWVRTHPNGARHYGARHPAGNHVIDLCAMSGGDPCGYWRAAVCHSHETNFSAIINVAGPLSVTKATPREALEALVALFSNQQREVDQIMSALKDSVSPLIPR